MEELKKCMKDMKKNKAPGPDDGRNVAGNHIGYFIYFWTCLIHGGQRKRYPRNLHELIKEDTEKQENYRPISLLNLLYKVFAKILKQRIKGKVKK